MDKDADVVAHDSPPLDETSAVEYWRIIGCASEGERRAFFMRRGNGIVCADPLTGMIQKKEDDAFTTYLDRARRQLVKISPPDEQSPVVTLSRQSVFSDDKPMPPVTIDVSVALATVRKAAEKSPASIAYYQTVVSESVRILGMHGEHVAVLIEHDIAYGRAVEHSHVVLALVDLAADPMVAQPVHKKAMKQISSGRAESNTIINIVVSDDENAVAVFNDGTWRILRLG
jgi:hypothetical protein